MVGILNQYPHYLYRDTEEGWKLIGMCREETNGKGGHIKAADAEYYLYSSLIQMPVGVPKVPEGVEVVVSERELEPEELADPQPLIEEGTIRISGTCAKFDPGRLHNRMWI